MKFFALYCKCFQEMRAWSLMYACHRGDLEVLKNRPLSPAEAFAVFSRTFLSLTCQEEKHIMRCCCPCGYELSMWQLVCASVFKCALFIWGMSPVYPVEWNCIETGEWVSPQPGSDTERPWLRADTYISHSLHITLLTCLSSAGAT